MTKISICIATYNQEDYIESSIRSAYMQTVRPFEIIVSNDCSTDGTQKILDKLSKEISILKTIHQPVNLGISRNVNQCLKAATGDFIVRLDSDDLLKPQYLEVLSQKLLDHPGAGYAHCAVDQIDQHDRYMLTRKLSRKQLFEKPEKALWKARKGYRVSANIIMFRKQALEKINYIDQKIDYVEDYYTASRISAAAYGNIYVSDSLARYRVWVDAGKTRMKRKLDEIRGLTKVFSEVLEPAYKSRNWRLISLKRSRKRFAVRHSSCLSWDVFADEEKKKLIDSLNALSDHPVVRYAVYMHTHKLGGIINLKHVLVINARNIVKRIIFR